MRYTNLLSATLISTVLGYLSYKSSRGLSEGWEFLVSVGTFAFGAVALSGAILFLCMLALGIKELK